MLSDPSRLRALRRTGLLDTPPEEAFNRLTRIVTAALNVPVSLVSLVEPDRQFFKSCVGLPAHLAPGNETPISHSLCRYVVEADGPLVLPDARQHPEFSTHPAVLELGVVAYAGFPFHSPEGEVLGSLCAIDFKSRQWTATDLMILEDLAGSVRTELSLRLIAEEAGDAASRLLRLESISDAALAHLSLDELLSELLDRIRSALGADTATVLLHERDELVVRASVGSAEREPPASVSVPLAGDEGIIGVLTVGLGEDQALGAEDRALLSFAAERLSRGISHAQMFEREQTTAQTLQRSVLPDRMLPLPGISAGVRYVPAQHAHHVGGDWYDVFALADGRAAFTVGDVAGHGIPSAAAMWRVRSALQAYMFQSGNADDALTRVDELLLAGPPHAMVTAVAVTLDPGAGRADIARAGHPPPVLLVPGRKPRVVVDSGGPPLAIVGAPYRPEAVTVEFPPGATLIAYTDGLIERRDEPIDVSVENLVRACDSAPAEVEALCDYVLAEMLGGEPPNDDVALLVIRNSTPSSGPS